MKTSFTLLVALFMAPQEAWADEFSNNFAQNLNSRSLNALAEDLGALMGGGSFHQGKALGFPLGFDAGVHVPMVGVQQANTILSDDGSKAHAVWGQFELGFARRLNLIGRFGQMYDADLVGGGLRYSLSRGRPGVSISALYSGLDHDFFELRTLSVNAVISVDVPFIRPYLGGGYDNSHLDVADSLAGPVRDGKAEGFRVEAGVNLILIPFTYINVGVGVANEQELVHVGAGVQF